MTQHSTDKSWFDQLQEHMVEWRRYLHKNPEISFQESQTAAFVADKLESWGIEVRRQVGGARCCRYHSWFQARACCDAARRYGCSPHSG